MTNTANTEGIEIEAPPTMCGVASDDGEQEDFEQLPIANDNYDEQIVNNNNQPNSRHASKKYIVVAAFVGMVAFAAFFGSGYGIGNAANKSNAATAISSASNVAFTASLNHHSRRLKLPNQVKLPPPTLVNPNQANQNLVVQQILLRTVLVCQLLFLMVVV